MLRQPRYLVKRIRVIHTPPNNQMEPYVVAEVITNLTEKEARYIIAQTWAEFQKTKPDCDSNFEDFLTDLDEYDFRSAESDSIDVNV